MPEPYHSVHLVPPSDSGYIAFMRRAAQQRPSRGGPRHAGELLGGLFEQAVRHWLARSVPLLEERILSWKPRHRERVFDTLYRELDAVWQIDRESLCLYEIKLTTPEQMADGKGLQQLDRAADILFAARRYQYVLKRLVYVAEEPVPVLEGDIPALLPDEEYEEVGVVWVSPTAVEAAARELDIQLPENWLAEEARQGAVEDPEADAWRSYADTAAREASTDGTGASPLADALRRALDRREGAS